jgi:hypothetical protein
MTIHQIKCKPEYFKHLLDGTKTAEIRENDRDYQVGDHLLICEFDAKGYTRREVMRTVSHVLTADKFAGLPKGWVCLSFARELVGYVCGDMFMKTLPRLNYPKRKWVEVYK